MHVLSWFVRSTIVAICVTGFVGCEQGQNGAAGGEEHAQHEHEHAHDHGAEGPHGGHIIELGNENYHAELTHEADGNRVTIYFLGGDAKTVKPIAAESVTINTSGGGESEQYILPAVPQEGESAGQASRFVLESEPLHTIVAGESEETVIARLNVTIDGEPFVGLIETDPHHHDHDHGHGHEH